MPRSRQEVLYRRISLALGITFALVLILPLLAGGLIFVLLATGVIKLFPNK